jgi:hypothetical protein
MPEANNEECEKSEESGLVSDDIETINTAFIEYRKHETAGAA